MGQELLRELLPNSVAKILIVGCKSGLMIAKA